VLAGTNDAYLVSVDAKTGKSDTGFGVGGKVDLLLALPGGNRATRQVAGRRPLVAGDIVIMGSAINDSAPNKEMPPGYVQAFDVRTGKSRWIFHTVPRAGEVGFDTWEDGSAEYSGNSNVWAGMAYDPELDYVYMPTSTPTNDYYGGHRLGDNLFAESLVCVEAKTGKRVWHFQAVHHGLWDYDFPSTPVLGETTVDGERMKVVMQASKQAFLYVFDRKTGKPVWPIEERPVAQSTVPGERHRRQPDGLHGGAQGTGLEAVEEFRPRSTVHAAVAQGDVDVAWYRRRGELAWRRIRPRDGRLLCRLPDEPLDPASNAGRKPNESPVPRGRRRTWPGRPWQPNGDSPR
jgi:quinoprotein glucose dehydrogenase